MCVRAAVFLRSGEVRWAETAGEIAEAIGTKHGKLPVRGYMPAGWRARHSECLCHVDVEALAKERDMTCEPPAYDDGTDHFDAWALREKVS